MQNKKVYSLRVIHTNVNSPCLYLEKEEQILFEISIGLLLGDCSIQKNSSKKIEKCRLKFLQGAKHKEYIYHLHQQYKKYVISDPFYDCKQKTYSFQTVFHPFFVSFFNIFYNESLKKTIGPYFLQNSIKPRSLAYWFMDDGRLLSYNKDYVRKGLVFNTQGFSFQEALILSNNLNSCYNLESWVKQNKKKPVIAIPGRKYQFIKDLVFPYIIDSMKYKFPKES